jgi:hypothetical protein
MSIKGCVLNASAQFAGLARRKEEFLPQRHRGHRELNPRNTRTTRKTGIFIKKTGKQETKSNALIVRSVCSVTLWQKIQVHLWIKTGKMLFRHAL